MIKHVNRIDIDAIDQPRERWLRAVLRSALSLTFPLFMRPSVPLRMQRAFLRVLTALATFAPRGLQRERVTLGSRPAERVVVPGETNEVAVLYLHGGGFISGSPASHRAITGHLARDLGGPVYALDYRLAPEASAPAALDDALGAWDALLASGWRSEQIALAGDSAGGNLALVLAMELQRRQLAQPAALLLLSPCTDLTFSELTVLAHSDPLLTPAWLAQCRALYQGAIPVTDPSLSPLYGDFTGLPPTLVQVGTEEILLADSLRLLAQAEAASATLTVEVYHACWHVFQVHAGVLTISSQAIARAAQFIRSSVAVGNA